MGRYEIFNQTVFSVKSIFLWVISGILLLFLIWIFYYHNKISDEVLIHVKSDLKEVSFFHQEILNSRISERILDSRYFTSNPDFLKDVSLYFRNPVKNSLVLNKWLSDYRNNHKLANILILDSLSGVAFDLNQIENLPEYSSKFTLNWSEVEKQPRFVSVNFNPANNEFLLNLVIPVSQEKKNNNRVMIFQFDARAIFPRSFAFNPTKYNSLQSFLKFGSDPSVLQLDSLVSNSNNFVVNQPFLNDFPVSDSKTGLGFISDKNVNGKTVFGWVVPIKNTNWILILEMDENEVQAGITDRTVNFIGWGLVLIFLFSAIAFFSLRWIERSTEFAYSAIKDENVKLSVRLQEFSRDANVMMWTLDETGRFLDVNEKALEVLGYTLEEFLSIPAIELRAQHLKENFKTELDRAKKQGNLQFNLELKRKDGTTFPAQLISKRFVSGNQVIFNTIAFDMTERVELENQVKRLNRLFRIVTDIDEIILHSKSPEHLFQEICKAMVTTADFSLVHVSILLPGSNKIKPVAWNGSAEGYLKGSEPAFIRTTEEEAVFKILHENQQTIRVINSTKDPGLIESEHNLMVSKGFQSKCSILVKQNKNSVGVLTILSDFPGYFSDEIIEILSLLPERISFSLDALASEEIRKIQQVKLSESERFYFALFNNNQMPMWIYEEESFLIREVNEAACNRYGYSRDEFIKLSLFDLRPESEHGKLIGATNSPEHNPKWSGPWLHKLKDGTLCNVEVSSQKVVFKNRKCRLVLINDITVKLQAELELKASEHRFRLAIDLFPDVFAIYNPDLTYRFINKMMIQESGYYEEEILGKTDRQLFPVEMTREFVPLLEKAKVTLEAQSEEIYLKWFGEPHFTRLSYIPVLDSDHNLELILCTAIDITSIKMTQKHLEREQFLLNSAQQIGHSGSWEWEKETGLVTWSDNLWRLLGLEPACAVPTLELFFLLLPRKTEIRRFRSFQKLLLIRPHIHWNLNLF